MEPGTSDSLSYNFSTMVKTGHGMMTALDIQQTVLKSHGGWAVVEMRSVIFVRTILYFLAIQLNYILLNSIVKLE